MPSKGWIRAVQNSCGNTGRRIGRISTEHFRLGKINQILVSYNDLSLPPSSMYQQSNQLESSWEIHNRKWDWAIHSARIWLNSDNEECGIITFCLRLWEVLDACSASASTDINPEVNPVPSGVWMDKVETDGLQEEVVGSSWSPYVGGCTLEAGREESEDVHETPGKVWITGM